MEADDLLAYHVNICGPVMLIIIIPIIEIAHARGIVEQRIHPHVNHMAGIEVYGDAPFEGRTGNAQILQTRLDEVIDHLIDAGSGLKKRTGFQQFLYRFCIFGQFEEICFLFCIANGAAAVRTFAVYQLTFGPEALTGSAVHSLVCSFIDVPVVIHLFKDLLNGLHMVIIRGADKPIIGDVHQLPEILNALGAFYDIVYKLLRSDLRLFCLFFDLLSVLIGSGQKHDIITAHPFISGDRIRRHRAVSMSDVQFVGRVINWGCNIKFTLAHVSSSIYLSICFYP